MFSGNPVVTAAALVAVVLVVLAALVMLLLPVGVVLSGLARRALRHVRFRRRQSRSRPTGRPQSADVDPEDQRDGRNSEEPGD